MAVGDVEVPLVELLVPVALAFVLHVVEHDDPAGADDADHLVDDHRRVDRVVECVP